MEARIVDVQQNTPEWLEFRKGKIGASDAASILGISPWETKQQCWERIVFGTSRKPNKAMIRGSKLEGKALHWLNKKTGREYRPVVLQSLAHEEFIASLDGFWVDNSGKVHIAEIKCPGMQSHLSAIFGTIPEIYKPQLNHQMDLAGVDEMIYVSFDGDDGVILSCTRDGYYCVNLLAEELNFLASTLDFKTPEYKCTK